MADLLECLLQVKGLLETTRRLSMLVRTIDLRRWMVGAPGGRPSAAEWLALLVETEVVHGAWLRAMLGSPRPALAVVDEGALLGRARRRGWRPDEALEQFLSHRRANLDLLDRCTAADFARTGVHPARREMTVADLVAVMMASDAERVAAIRMALDDADSKP